MSIRVRMGKKEGAVDAIPRQLDPDPGAMDKVPVSAHVPAKKGRSGVSSTVASSIPRPAESDTRSLEELQCLTMLQ